MNVIPLTRKREREREREREKYVLLRAGLHELAALCADFLCRILPTSDKKMWTVWKETHIGTYKNYSYVLPTACMCVLCGSENKQRLFPYTALTDWFL
jgi:hypothetical protein